MANFNNHHNNRNHHGRGKKNHNVENIEIREEKENRESKRGHDQQEARVLYRERRERENRENKENREHKENRDGQAISTFMLGEKELDNKNAQFHYDKGWYSIVDITGEEKNVVYKSKNAQEAYLKWNVYIGRKKERSQRVDKAD